MVWFARFSRTFLDNLQLSAKLWTYLNWHTFKWSKMWEKIATLATATRRTMLLQLCNVRAYAYNSLFQAFFLYKLHKRITHGRVILIYVNLCKLLTSLSVVPTRGKDLTMSANLDCFINQVDFINPSAIKEGHAVNKRNIFLV